MSVILSSALLILLQVGPNPGVQPADPSDILANRPPRNPPRNPPKSSRENRSEAAKLGWLKECFALIESDPARADAKAQIRRSQTTGTERIAANHCLGLAASRLKRWNEAQTAFVAARDEAPESDRRYRSRLGTMAGNAALAKGDKEAALALFAEARSDAGASGDGTLQSLALGDEARALVALGRQGEAEPLLAKACGLSPEDGELRLLYATLLRRQGKLKEAQAQIEIAASLRKDDPAIGLEAGVIAMLDGREAAAKSSWQSVIDSAPQSHEAKTARFYLDQLAAPAKAP